MAHRKYIDISPTADACIFSALALLLLPLNWILAAVEAALFHEFCHYLALKLCGAEVYEITIDARGTVMETEALSEIQELLCALAGPAGSLLLTAMIRIFPELAICAGIQGLYNLLPIFPLDGGRAVRSLLGLISPQKHDALAKQVQQGTMICLIAAGVAAYFYLRLGFGVLVITFFLVRKALPRKIPCKEGRKRVQ